MVPIQAARQFTRPNVSSFWYKYSRQARYLVMALVDLQYVGKYLALIVGKVQSKLEFAVLNCSKTVPLVALLLD